MSDLSDELEGELDSDDEGTDDGNRLVGASARAVLDYVGRAIVEDPDSIVVEADEHGRRLTLRLHAAPDDLGRLIGRRGRIAQSIRAVVRAAGAREGVDVSVDIVD